MKPKAPKRSRKAPLAPARPRKKKTPADASKRTGGNPVFSKLT